MNLRKPLLSALLSLAACAAPPARERTGSAQQGLGGGGSGGAYTGPAHDCGASPGDTGTFSEGGLCADTTEAMRFVAPPYVEIFAAFGEEDVTFSASQSITIKVWDCEPGQQPPNTPMLAADAGTCAGPVWTWTTSDLPGYVLAIDTPIDATWGSGYSAPWVSAAGHPLIWTLAKAGTGTPSPQIQIHQQDH